MNFNPQGSREPRLNRTRRIGTQSRFQSTRLSRASTCGQPVSQLGTKISIHKALASLDISCLCFTCNPLISIHKALASLDGPRHRDKALVLNFNPQGSREPRRSAISSLTDSSGFQSTRLSRASTYMYESNKPIAFNFNPQGSREPRQHVLVLAVKHFLISIHKALASLDSKIIQNCSTSPLTFYALCSSLPSSTNSVHSPSPLSQPFPLFFRCESPWHFMSAWHSHLV